ncbi:MAG: alanine racemase [Desulfobacterales bacterium]|nr:alanine racemase [Desulfobacterales bacterium]
MDAKRRDRYPIVLDLPAHLETPAVLVDRDILQANIDRMQALADGSALVLRPHVKTHKSVQIARLQLAAGANGLTVSKVEEALVFIEAGLPSVTLAYPLVSAVKLDRLLGAARRCGCDLRLIVDSMAGVDLLAARAVEQGAQPGVFIKVDVGLQRCGRKPDDPLVPALAQALTDAVGLDFRGLLSHAGHVYSAVDGNAAARTAEEERLSMTALASRLRRAGYRVPEVSVGSTPTVLAARRFDGLTEIRPGNYVFMDQTPLRLGLIPPFSHCAQRSDYGGQRQRTLCHCRCRRQNPQFGSRGPRHGRDRRLWPGLGVESLGRYGSTFDGWQTFRRAWLRP